MTLASIPDFYEVPQRAWIKCQKAEALGSMEVACSVPRVTGDSYLIVTSNKFFDDDLTKILAVIIAKVPDGRLVDFPSGDRLAVPSSVVEAEANGNPV